MGVMSLSFFSNTRPKSRSSMHQGRVRIFKRQLPFRLENVMPTTYCATGILLVSLLVASAAPDHPAQIALKGLDPVELVAGKEVMGKEGVSVVRGLYQYRFASAANKQLFEKSPERYAIQMGGACARMGPLSGLGSPDRFLVYDQRIYLFASDGCRSTFQKNPEAFLDQDETPPKSSGEQRQRGRELLDKAVAGLGGAEAVDAVKAVRIRTKITYKQGEKASTQHQTATFAFPGCYHEIREWDGGNYGHAVTPQGGYRFSKTATGNEIFRTDTDVDVLMRRGLKRYPLALLKVRTVPGFQVATAGKSKVDDTEVELLTVWVEGATTILGVDPNTGHILQVTYRGRLGAGGIGDVVLKYGDFRKVNDLTLPFSVHRTFNNKVVAEPRYDVESIVLNPDVDSGLFALPR